MKNTSHDILYAWLALLTLLHLAHVNITHDDKGDFTHSHEIEIDVEVVK